MVSQLWKRANGWYHCMQCLESYLLPYILARANTALLVFSESKTKGRDVQVDLSSVARLAESSPASPAPEKYPQPVESCRFSYQWNKIVLV